MSFRPLNHTVIQSGVAVLRYRFITYRMQADDGLSEGGEGGQRQRAREVDRRFARNGAVRRVQIRKGLCDNDGRASGGRGADRPAAKCSHFGGGVMERMTGWSKKKEDGGIVKMQ